jgi:hypothetical protein
MVFVQLSRCQEEVVHLDVTAPSILTLLVPVASDTHEKASCS